MRICKNQGPIWSQFRIKNTITFCSIWRFLGVKMGPKPKDGEVRGQVFTTFLEAPPSGLTHAERVSVVAAGKLELFQLQCRFLGFRIHFFNFGSLFGCHIPRMEKNRLDIRMQNFMLDILIKIFLKNLQAQKSSLDPENFQQSLSGC